LVDLCKKSGGPPLPFGEPAQRTAVQPVAGGDLLPTPFEDHVEWTGTAQTASLDLNLAIARGRLDHQRCGIDGIFDEGIELRSNARRNPVNVATGRQRVHEFGLAGWKPGITGA